jgi:hypothetical protein
MGIVETGPQIIATTHRLDKYDGRFRLTVEDLHEMEQAYWRGEVIHTAQHDPSQVSTREVAEASVEQLEDGEYALVVNFRVDEREWSAALEKRRQGIPVAWSYSSLVSFGKLGTGETGFVVAADAGSYTQDEIVEAAALIEASEAVEVAELVQFGAADVCQVVIVVQQHQSTLQQWGPSVAGGLAWPALLGLARATKWARHRVQFVRRDKSVLETIVETDETSVLESAGQHLKELDGPWRNPLPKDPWVFDKTRQLWVSATQTD